MKKSLFFSILSAALIAGIGQRLGVGQTAALPFTLEQTISDYNRQIADWDREANWQASLIISVILLGGVIAICQGSKSPRVKTITIILGVATSTITATQAKIFTADYSSLRRAAGNGRAITGQLEGIVSVINETHPTGQQLTDLNAQFILKTQQFSSLSASLGGGNAPPATPASLLTLPPVFAQSVSPAPSWITQLPSAPNLLYFTGAGTDPQLSSAQTSSLSDGLNNALQEISNKLPGVSLDVLKTLINGSYAVQDTYFRFDKQSGSYTYFTLVRLSNLVLAISRPTRQVYQQRGWRPADLTSQGSMVIALDDSGGVSNIYSGAQGTHIHLLFRLRGSLTGSAVAADESYIYVSATSQLGCSVVRYSLASRATDERLIRPGKRCIGMATDGSALYVVLPDDRSILFLKGWTADPGTWDLGNVATPGLLVYDKLANRLITANPEGKAYGISTSNGSTTLLADGLGYVESLAVSSQYLLAASGKSVLFRNRVDNRGANPPSGVAPLPGGILVGITVDQAGSLWIADYDHKLIEGPYSLN